ncbi:MULTISPECIES: hypothetical protein [Rhizobium]|uniref:Uncharacterized protein n=1 Tax=Rhizobium favelukesii TaxID=348824 RepID=W6RQ90_9HYPH|nr:MULTISPECIES: hypothetical protein [Rhizobium]MCS0457845.1 hypothetical protein [Rhizobium favelukesii]UFS80491.1 hypothetical protein LPB79_04500 [Rhizobium sp. T136]CDM62345.1 hypothetical protein LPU83_pLPU83d_0975 [Rhizobium favelukesii]
MRHLLDATEQSVATENWYAALMLALTLPDICSKADGNGEKRYVTWARQWVEPGFTFDILVHGNQEAKEARLELLSLLRLSDRTEEQIPRMSELSTVMEETKGDPFVVTISNR